MAVMEAERTTTKPTCKATKRNGEPCQSTILSADGLCSTHRTSREELAQRGRNGGRQSANAKRAHQEAAQRRREELLRDSRAMLREEFATDEEWQAALVNAFRDPIMAGEAKARTLAAAEFINQTQGKPQQNIQTKTDVTITVVSRLDAALETHADIELPESAVAELEA